VVGVYEEVLGVEGASPPSDFFELGGDSLLATELLLRLRAALGDLPVSLRDVYRYPSARRLAARLAEG